MMGMFSILLVLMASGFKTYQTVCFKYIQLAACQPYFNKPVYKKVKGGKRSTGPKYKVCILFNGIVCSSSIFSLFLSAAERYYGM